MLCWYLEEICVMICLMVSEGMVVVVELVGVVLLLRIVGVILVVFEELIC